VVTPENSPNSHRTLNVPTMKEIALAPTLVLALKKFRRFSSVWEYASG
jgi:hypothetical protein